MVSTDYKIVGFDQARGQISVKFDELSYPIPIDLHINEQGLYPEGEVLDIYIRGMCPVSSISRELTISKGVVNASKIAALVEILPTVPLSTEEDESQYLTAAEKFDVYITVVVQRVLAEMAGATV
jgi:hypothetical protein